MEISITKNVNVFFEHYPEIDAKYFKEGLIISNGVVLGEYDFDDMYGDWCRDTDAEED